MDIRLSSRAAQTVDGQHYRLADPEWEYVRPALDALQQQQKLRHNHRKHCDNMLGKRPREQQVAHLVVLPEQVASDRRSEVGNSSKHVLVARRHPGAAVIL